MEDQPAPTEPSTSALLDPAAERIRKAATWLIAGFGAVGAVLLTGLQFSDIGKLEGVNRWWAIGAVIAAFVGLGLVLYGGATILVPKSRTLVDLMARRNDEATRYLEHAAPELLTPFPSVRSVFDARQKAGKTYSRAFWEWFDDPTQAHADAVDAWSDYARPIEMVANRAIAWANYMTLQKQYKRAVRRMIIPGLALVGAGLIVFATKITDTPSPASSVLTAAGLSGARLNGVDLSDSVLERANLSSATLMNADLTDANLKFARLRNANLQGANLRGADLTGAQLAGAQWHGATCPDGALAEDVNGSCVAHRTADK